MATLTATADTAAGRLGVTAAGLATSGPVAFYRVHPGGERYLVRGPVTASGGAAFVWDYEAPFRLAVTYEVDDSGTTVTSGAVTLPTTEAWLRAPGLPGYDAAVELIEKPKPGRARTAAVLRPLGRKTAVVISSVLQSSEFDLKVRTYGYTQARALVGLVEQAPTALLVVPGLVDSWQYVAILSLAEAGVVDWRPADLDGNDENDPGSMTEWSIACVVTDRPVGDMYGDPNASYQALLDTYPTYQALKDANATYLDVLKGV